MPSEPGTHAFEGMFDGGVVNFLNAFLVVCCVLMSTCLHHGVTDSLWDSVFSFRYDGPGDRIWVFSLVSRYLDSLSCSLPWRNFETVSSSPCSLVLSPLCSWG